MGLGGPIKTIYFPEKRPMSSEEKIIFLATQLHELGEIY